MLKDKGQFLAKAKSMIVQNIQKRTVFTRADLNRLISLSPHVDLNPCFLITLQALTETRYIDILEAPNMGENSYLPQRSPQQHLEHKINPSRFLRLRHPNLSH